MSKPRLSICIVNYKAGDYLDQCLESIYTHPPEGEFEIIVVDNASMDGTAEMLEADYPKVRLISNRANLGYTTPMNQALRAGQGDFLLQLNPDTIIPPKALDKLVVFLEDHPEAGVCGPKVLNPDGTLQPQCRRGESRPMAVIAYFTGLNRLFPKSKRLGGYLLNYLDEDETNEVAGVSGSCMLIRRQMVDQIGFLDEQFFAYQEDADYCFRARAAGWNVYYYPEAQITHYGGQGGSRVEPYRSIREWHRSYWLYYRKNLAADYPAIFNAFFYGLMGVKLAWALGMNFVRRGKFATPEIETMDTS